VDVDAIIDLEEIEAAEVKTAANNE